jgi:hypothetical protein
MIESLRITQPAAWLGHSMVMLTPLSEFASRESKELQRFTALRFPTVPQQLASRV